MISVLSCYVNCNCNAANIDVVALNQPERLNNDLCYTLEKSIFQFVYTCFCLPFFVCQKGIASNAATREKKAISPIVKFFYLIKVLQV